MVGPEAEGAGNVHAIQPGHSRRLGIAEAVWVLSRNNMIGHWKVNAAFARTEKSGDL
jgi:hypothetical protein